MIELDALAWERMAGLLPAVVQDADSGEVRMLGYMNRQALEATIADGLVTFFSRSRNKLWRKGESSGNSLALVDIASDCDSDALLIIARPNGPTCHAGTTSCFGDRMAQGTGFIADLERRLVERAKTDPTQSYTARLLNQGVKRVAQKVGEEGVETALAGVAGDSGEVTREAADLVYHLTLLLQARDLGWRDVIGELRGRHAASGATAPS
jgi:phosphoribosyl-ATP pyrophosphohydrolase/phosphoribosyl-AMP cyclohydrolase